MPSRPQGSMPHDAEIDEAKVPLRFSRSPHPYHRRSLNLPDRIHSNKWLAPITKSPSSNTPVLPDHGPGTSAYFDFDHRKRRKSTTSPSDSGTEADDERPLLRALTAPQSRPRKGLKEPRGTDSDPLGTPLLTPSILEEDRSRLLVGHAYQERQRSKPTLEADVVKAKEKRRRRGRAEYTRRIVETALLGVSGYLSFRASPLDIGQGTQVHGTLDLRFS